MDKQTGDLFDQPLVEGADYVTLVIEWDDTADAIEREIAEADEVTERRDISALLSQPVQMRPRAFALAVGVLGALGLVALAGWGIHRLRMA